MPSKRTPSFFALATLILGAMSQIDRPVLYPAADRWSERYMPGLFNNWPRSEWNFTRWDDIPGRQNKVPHECTGKHDPWWLKDIKSVDFTVYDVYYDDCAEPWVVCYHKDVPSNKLTPFGAFETLGQVPVSLRQWVAVAVVIPSQYAQGGAHQVATSVVYNEDHVSSLTVHAHELTHSIDNLKYGDAKPNGAYWSQTDEWKNTVANDSHVVTPHAAGDWRESLAEVGILGAYDIATKGGLSELESRWELVGKQLALFKTKFGAYMDPASSGCPSKVKSLGTSDKSSQVGFRVADYYPDIPEGSAPPVFRQ